jgi:hypothetical protein
MNSTIDNKNNNNNNNSNNNTNIIIEKYSNNSAYEGEILNGMRNGKGTFYFSDGGIY